MAPKRVTRFEIISKKVNEMKKRKSRQQHPKGPKVQKGTPAFRPGKRDPASRAKLGW